jgi:hypothetical protein
VELRDERAVYGIAESASVIRPDVQLSLESYPRLMADGMKTENRTGAYTKAVGLFVPIDGLAAATAGDPQTVASNLNSGRGAGNSPARSLSKVLATRIRSTGPV